MTDASLTSEPEKLLPVIQADEQAALAMLEHAFRNVSPRALKDVSFGDISHAFAKHRLSSPVSGTDMVMVPREPTEAMIRAGQEAREVASVVYVEDVWSAMLNAAPASPSTPIPVIAEAGERALRDGLRVAKRAILKAAKDTLWCDDTPADTVIDRIDYLLAEADGQSSMAATLDNTAAEGLRASVRGIRSNFERIAAHDPNDQPHYRNGVRPWGTGDLRHCIDTLLAVEATLTAKTEKAE